MEEVDNATYQHFLLFPQCFQMPSSSGASKFVEVWEIVNTLSNKPWFLHVSNTILLKTLWGNCEISRGEQFLLFPQCFLPVWITLCHFHQNLNCRLQTLSVWKSLKFVVWERVNPFPNQPWFLRVCSTNILKTLREKEKLIVTSNFSFSHNVFYPFEELSATFIRSKIVVFKLFQFGRV